MTLPNGQFMGSGGFGKKIWRNWAELRKNPHSWESEKHLGCSE